MMSAVNREQASDARWWEPHGRSRTPLWVVGAAIVGFLIGFGWQYARAERARHDASLAGQALEAARLHATLSDAVIKAQTGDYELARQGASAFFTGVQRRLMPALGGDVQASARPLLAERDPVITGLARSDPASASVLSQLLTRYREVVRRAGLDSVAVGGG